MAQKDKDLLLKDLCTRQPYGVILKTPQGDGYLNEVSLSIFGHELGINIKATERTYFKLEECKPYLRTKESMTEEELMHYHDLCMWDEVAHYEFGELGTEIQYYDTWESIDYLNSIHVDYRGLIAMGLAIKVSKENNQYKK